MEEIKTNWKLSDLKPVSGDVEYYRNEERNKMLIVEMKMPKRCFDCPMHDWTYGLHETRQNVLVCNARHELTPILCQTIPNGDERPDWCPIKGEVEYARMVHERIMDEIKDNVSMRRLEEELFVLCKEKEDANN